MRQMDVNMWNWSPRKSNGDSDGGCNSADEENKFVLIKKNLMGRNKL